MIEKILEIVVQKLNALAAKMFKKESYPYLPPLSRRERRKFERDNKKAEKNIALCRRCIKPQVVKLRSRVTMSNFEMQYYCRDKSGMEQLKRRAIESVYDEILKGMEANGLISISQYNDIYSNNTIYEGTCEIYKNK